MREEPAHDVAEGTVLWEPSEERKAAANLTRYLRWLRETKGLSFLDAGNDLIASQPGMAVREAELRRR